MFDESFSQKSMELYEL